METEKVYVIVWLYSTWSVADVGHGATFGGDVAHVDLLGLDLDLLAMGSAKERDQQRGLKLKKTDRELHKCFGEMEATNRKRCETHHRERNVRWLIRAVVIFVIM